MCEDKFLVCLVVYSLLSSALRKCYGARLGRHIGPAGGCSDNEKQTTESPLFSFDHGVREGIAIMYLPV